jgi:hypothetical protein
MTWDRITRLANDWLPKPRILHPWPQARFAVLDDELDVRERLDAGIARAVKHLVQTKAMKQMLGQTSVEREDKQPGKITARSDPLTDQ